MKRGDIHKLGDHILICGDSIEDADLIRQVIKDNGNFTIRCIATDPPYGVAYVESKNAFGKLKISKGDTPIAGDQEQTPAEYTAFTRKWLEVIKAHLSTYNTFFIFNADKMYCALRQGIVESGGYYSQQIIWVKNQIVPGRLDYLPQHEVIAYGWYGKHKRERGKGKSVITYPKPNKSRLHPTMKPVGLMRLLIQDTTKIREWVYEPFGGSGSTLLACEHLKRNCLAIELDTNYCSKIIERWEKATGKKAQKV